VSAPATVPIPLRVCPPGEGDVRRQMEALRRELDDEMAARAIAESEADFRAEHVAELRAEVERLRAANARLDARLKWRVWTRAWPFALGGFAGGLVAVALWWAAGL
jgi:hypothetical protein